MVAGATQTTRCGRKRAMNLRWRAARMTGFPVRAEDEQSARTLAYRAKLDQNGENGGNELKVVSGG